MLLQTDETDGVAGGRAADVSRDRRALLHDIRNLLSVALIEMDRLALGADVGPAAPGERAYAISCALHQAALLADAVVEAPRAGPRVPPCTDAAAIARAFALVGDLVAPEVTVLADAVPGLTVAIDPSHFTQILTNLAVNARQAMPRGGCLRLRLARATGGGGYGRLTVEDTGRGMEPALARRLFEPGFSTQEGPGHGLGATIVRALAQRYGGDAWVASAPGRGTQVTVILPLRV